MGFEEFVQEVLSYFRQIAPKLSEEYGIKLDALIQERIQNKIRDTLEAEKNTLNIVITREFPDTKKIENAVRNLLLTMIIQAKKENRIEIMPGDYELALVALKWEIWPFCSSGNASLIKGKKTFG